MALHGNHSGRRLLRYESPYLNHIAVDAATGMIDLMFEWRSDPDAATTNDVGYAQSPDGGRTWETAAGAPLALPITHNVKDTILKTAPSGSGLENNGGLTVDARGRPHGVVVFAELGGSQDVEQLWFDGRRWHRGAARRHPGRSRPAIAGHTGRKRAGCWAHSATRVAGRRCYPWSGAPLGSHWLLLHPDGKPCTTRKNWHSTGRCRC